MQDNEIYFKIYKWMPNLLGLKGAELEIYAIIYSFSSSGKPFTKSANWIGDLTGLKRWQITNVLKILTEKNYILKENSAKGYANSYTVNPDFVYTPEKTPTEPIPVPETPAKNSTDNPQVNIIVEKFNEICTDLERVNKISSKTVEKIENLLKNGYTERDFEKCFKTVNASRFLRGQKNKFKAQFSWIVDPKNFEKVLSGIYTDMQAFEVAGLEHFKEDNDFSDEYEELWNNFDAWDNSSMPKKEEEPGVPDITDDENQDFKFTNDENQDFKLKMECEVYSCKTEQEEREMLETFKKISKPRYWEYFKQNYKLQYTSNAQML